MSLGKGEAGNEYILSFICNVNRLVLPEAG